MRVCDDWWEEGWMTGWDEGRGWDEGVRSRGVMMVCDDMREEGWSDGVG